MLKLTKKIKGGTPLPYEKKIKISSLLQPSWKHVSSSYYWNPDGISDNKPHIHLDGSTSNDVVDFSNGYIVISIEQFQNKKLSFSAQTGIEQIQGNPPGLSQSQIDAFNTEIQRLNNGLVMT